MDNHDEEVVAEAIRTNEASDEMNDAHSKLQQVADYFDRSFGCHWNNESDESAKRALVLLTEIDSRMAAVSNILQDRIQLGAEQMDAQK